MERWTQIFILEFHHRNNRKKTQTNNQWSEDIWKCTQNFQEAQIDFCVSDTFST